MTINLLWEIGILFIMPRLIHWRLQGNMGRVSPPQQTRGSRERHNLLQRGPCGAPAENGFGAFWTWKNASNDNGYGISIRSVGINSVNLWCYITFKAGRNRERVQNLGLLSVPGDLVIFPGQAVKIRDSPGKIRTDGHLSVSKHWLLLECCHSLCMTIPWIYEFTVYVN